MVPTMNKKQIVVGMSGGVDSSVAAWLLKQQGHHVVGVFMQNWEDDNNDQYCSIKEDAIDALSVADLIGIDIEIVNFAREYKERVFSYFLAEYANGRTPNPDILCNAEIKFKAFLDYALALGADYIATGHYARKETRDGMHYLLKAADTSKDQSYFLCRLNQYQLSKALFPLGNMKKSEVRRLAEQARLPTAHKKDSTGICFIGERPFRDFLQRYLPTQPGSIVTPDGSEVGKHAGLMYYTIGQRQGLGIGGQGKPWFVAAKDIPNNRLIVVQGHDHSQLFSRTLQLSNLSWTQGVTPRAGRYQAKIRYRTPEANCQLILASPERATLVFDDPQWAITPGQAAVLYEAEICIGGGIIDADEAGICSG